MRKALFISLILILFVSAFTTPATSPCTRYVSVSGSDANNGLTTGTPWATLQKAANASGSTDIDKQMRIFNTLIDLGADEVQ